MRSETIRWEYPMSIGGAERVEVIRDWDGIQTRSTATIRPISDGAWGATVGTMTRFFGDRIQARDWVLIEIGARAIGQSGGDRQ